MIILLRLTLLVLSAAGFSAPAAPASLGSAVLEAGEAVEWKASASLPLGAEYHLIREDPRTGGIQALVRFPKGYSLPPHAHDFDETLVVLKGRLRVGIGGTERVLSAGGYAWLPSGVVHELKAEGRKGVVMLLNTTGPYSLKAP